MYKLGHCFCRIILRGKQRLTEITCCTKNAWNRRLPAAFKVKTNTSSPWAAPSQQCASEPCSVSHQQTTARQSHLLAAVVSEAPAYCGDKDTSDYLHQYITTPNLWYNMVTPGKWRTISPHATDLSMLLIWLCKARKDTGDSMASLLLAHSLTTFSPVLSIFSVSWSTAMLLGAHTKTGLQDTCTTERKGTRITRLE